VNKYPEFKSIDYAQVANDILDFWESEKIFEKSVALREGKSFTFYEGPPSANGTPGIHHVMARTVKDIVCRFKTLQGYQVKRKGGWDTHGLPVELQVEKQLGITKEDIGKKISIADYNAKCRETVMLYKDQWDKLTRKMGYWVDLENPYITYTNDYIETLWWILQQLYNKGLLYKGYTIQPYSPSDGTGLSSHELNQPGCYKTVKDTSVVGQFKVIRNAQSEFLFSRTKFPVYFLAWTTTPWTLPSNTALAVGAKILYVQVNTYNPYTFLPVSVILAKDLASAYFSKKQEGLKLEEYKSGDKLIPFETAQEFSGQQLVGLKYEQLMPYAQPLYDADKAFAVGAADFVTTQDGTGIVHSSPTFGADDFIFSKQNGIPPLTARVGNSEVPTVDKQGKFIPQIGKFLKEGVEKYKIKTHKPLSENDFYVKNYPQDDESHPDYKSTDVIISIILKEENKAFRAEKFEHSYPHSWRTDMPVLYYPLDSWFIRTTALKEKMAEQNKTINWKPESTGAGRFGNWLENLVDWNLSRSRYWGTPLPIWRTADGQEEKCIGSIAELRAEAKKAQEAGVAKNFDAAKELDLHRPYVDEIILVSPSGKPMYRETDLIDVWFDSGAMPYAQWHFPFENKAVFEKSYPADFIAEGVDQTRGWFFTLHALAVMLNECSEEIKSVNAKNGNGGVAFKNVISNGLVLDKDGNKMSKRKGNAVDPFQALDEYGADAVRWFLIENAPPWENLKYNKAGIEEIKRRFFGTLYNTYSFFALYANIDGFVKDENDAIPFDELPLADRWIISKEQKLIRQVTKAYNNYELTEAARLIQDFVNDQLSNWYIRLNRKRFWQPALRGELSKDKRAAYETLFECLLTTAQLMSPTAPFVSDWLYKNLTDNIREKAKKGKTPLQYETIHLTLLAEEDKKRCDEELECAMDYAQRICSLIHSIRKNHKIKVRTPLQKILLPASDKNFEKRIKTVEDIIKLEVNVKELQYIDDASGLLIKKAKPNFQTLGKQYGRRMKEVAAVIQSLSQEEIAQLEKMKTFAKGGFDLKTDDAIIFSEDIPGWAVALDNEITAALDITLTEDLKREGKARDFVNRIQNLRKDKNMEVLDKIKITIENNDEMKDVLQFHGAYIAAETQALSIDMTPAAEGDEIDMEDFILKVKIETAR